MSIGPTTPDPSRDGSQSKKMFGRDTRFHWATLRVEQAQARTRQAEARTKRAEARTVQAEARTEAARALAEKARAEHAQAQSEEAEARSEEADAQAEEAQARSDQEEARAEEAEAQVAQAEVQVEQAEVQVQKAEARVEQVEALREEAEARSQQALRASELRYRRLFEAAKDGILILDVETGRITDANPFLVDLLGYSLEEMISKTVGELSPFKDLESNESILQRLQQDSYVRYEDLPLETKDGRHIEVEFVCNVYEAGEKKVIQCNIRDITERKIAQEEIRRLNAELERRVIERSAQLEAANEQLGAFSFSVSHDLRAPVRHIAGFVEMLQKDAGPSLTEKSLRHLMTISQAAKRMGSLIDDLLAFSRIGQSELRKAQVDLEELVREAMDDFQSETRQRNIIWTVHPLPAVSADRALLRMVLVNLFSNAVKFTSARSEPKIEVACADDGSGETVILVCDNGAGFDPQYTGKLFGVFQRLHSHDEFEGTGIGLANVRRIIHRHGGRVWAQGAVDGGATFYFSIPKDLPAIPAS